MARRQSVVALVCIFTALGIAAFASVLLASTLPGAGDARVAALVGVYVVAVFALLGFAYFKLMDRRLGLFLLAAAHLVWFAGPAVTTFQDGRYWGDLGRYTLTPAVVSKTALLVTAFLAANLAGYLVVAARPGRAAVVGQVRQLPARWLWGLFLLGVVPYLAFGGGLQETWSSIMAGRTTSKGWSMGAHLVNERGPVIVIGRSALVAFSALALWLFASRRRWGLSRRAAGFVLGGALLGTFITFFDSGTRSWTLQIVAPPVVVALMARMNRRRLVRGTVLALLGLGVMVLAAQAQRRYRFTGNFEAVTAEDAVHLQDNDFFMETAIAVDLVPRRFEYIHQFEPWLFVANPIPRFLWPDKPKSETVRLFSFGRSGFDEYTRTGVSRLPSIVGQHWMSWGLLGVLLAGLAWGAGFGALERVVRGAPHGSLWQLFGVLGLVWLFSTSRGIYPGMHYPTLMIGLVAWLATRRLPCPDPPRRAW